MTMLDRPIDVGFERTSAAVARLLARRAVTAPLTPESDLKAIGLTSLDMVSLMLAVECEYGIMIPQSAMTPENFKTVQAINVLVASLQQA